ncbi:WEE protein kinase [Thecamonas trahens ATCC 50062]|uniref:WEE protein kinase n=1 Tax=Thecamonas trahens ATCC 50062 TaxID=461836 RepID=A0A0L0DW27_THETB|nr:WEE protein kinase [Thecamonas trahens ATCC 50062]KNC56377.1 WEE protein kinase [Thecamonas trahens ATCC 50062]|eukprot:XP_013760892.1 WEE protein kinase [Thecamonas trahens ATCC 50062]
MADVSPFPAEHASMFAAEFEVQGRLGSGSFAEVFKALWKVDGQVYAVKKSRHQFRGTRDRRRAIQEVEAIAELHSDHCVKYYRAWEEDGFLYIQMEFCAQGSLMNFIDSHAVLEEELIWHALIDIALGLEHIHSAGFLHLDIKPENILLDQNGSLKIGDFGITVRLEGGSSQTAALAKVDLEGDPAYLPQEVLQDDPSKPVGSGVDIFSLGATVLEMAANIEMPRGGPLWHDLREGRLPLEAMERHKRSAELVATVQWMMDPDPAKRPSAAELLAHPPIRRRSLHERNDVDGGGKLRSKVQAFCAAGAHLVSNILASPFRSMTNGSKLDAELSPIHSPSRSGEASSESSDAAQSSSLPTFTLSRPMRAGESDSESIDDEEIRAMGFPSAVLFDDSDDDEASVRMRDSPTVADIGNISRHLGFDDDSVDCSDDDNEAVDDSEPAGLLFSPGFELGSPVRGGITIDVTPASAVKSPPTGAVATPTTELFAVAADSPSFVPSSSSRIALRKRVSSKFAPLQVSTVGKVSAKQPALVTPRGGWDLVTPRTTSDTIFALPAVKKQSPLTFAAGATPVAAGAASAKSTASTLSALAVVPEWVSGARAFGPAAAFGLVLVVVAALLEAVVFSAPGWSLSSLGRILMLGALASLLMLACSKAWVAQLKVRDVAAIGTLGMGYAVVQAVTA